MKIHIPADISNKCSITVPISQAVLYDKDPVLLYFYNMENDDFDKEVSAFVKKARLSMGMTQDQLADVLGCTKSNVSGWENGRHVPPYRLLCVISKKSGVPLPTYKEPHDSLPEKQKDIQYIVEILNEMDEAEVKENKSHVDFIRFTKIKKETGKKVNDGQ